MVHRRVTMVCSKCKMLHYAEFFRKDLVSGKPVCLRCLGKVKGELI